MNSLVDLIHPDGIIALNSIARIGEPRDIQRQWGKAQLREIICSDGSRHWLGVRFVDALMRRPTQLMPAAEYTYALHAWADDAEQGVNSSPVIAWALCVDGDVRPVTAQGVNDGDMMQDGEGYVLMPDGSVQSVGEHAEPVWFETLEEFSQHAWKAIRDRRAAQVGIPDPDAGGAA